MVPGQKRHTVKSLQLSALIVVVARLERWERLSMRLTSEDLMRIVVDFRAFADPIVHLLIEYTSFSNPLKFCVLFLHGFMKKKKVKLYGPYATQIVDLLVDFELFDFEVLRTVSELNIDDQCSSYRRDELFSKFPNLQKLRIWSGLTDEVLISASKHFPELTVLDGSRDFFYTITDHGLLKLARLRKLKYVLLHPDHEERRRTNPTGNGLAWLVSQLPELVKLTFPGYRLCDALNSLKLSKSLLLTVKSLDFGYSDMDIDICIAISNVCPNLERLRINVRETNRKMDNEEHLNFGRLKELCVETVYNLWNAHNIYEFKSVWRQLLVLHLDRFGLELHHMITVSDNCPNVKFLAFGGECADYSLSLHKCLCPTWPLLFPGLQNLAFFRGQLRNLYFFMHKRSNLVRVSITGQGDEIYVLESLGPDHGFWPKLESLSLTILDRNHKEVYDEALSHHLVEVLPSLKQMSVSIERGEEGVILTSSRGNDVALCSNVSFKLLTMEPELDHLDCWEMK